MVAALLVPACQCNRGNKVLRPLRDDAGPMVSAPVVVPPGQPVVVASAGDIAGRSNRQAVTSRLLLQLAEREKLAAILPLGDLVYPRGEYHDFLAYYHPTWGHPTLRALSRPVPGNHEYDQGRSDGQGYFDYWNGPGQIFGQAGERGSGYYSFDLGEWHLVAINSSDKCRRVPCTPGSPMYEWLRRDLAQNKRPCVLAYWHHPRFQMGVTHKDTPHLAPIWDALYDARADVVLTGHDHNYQQLAPLDKEGRVDPDRGIRSFVVGTGGAYAYPKFDPNLHQGAAEKMLSHQLGVLLLTLEPRSYRWRFVVADGSPGGHVAAEGRDDCR